MIAITGANGYVGNIIATALAKDGNVLRLVRRPEIDGDLAWSFDISVPEFAAELRARRVSRIVHAAWDMQSNRLQDLERGCVAGSFRLLEAAESAGMIPVTFISSISAFAGARSAYGKAKLLVESKVQAQGGTVLRFGLVYGEGHGGMLDALRKAVVGGRFIPVIGDGRAPQYLLDQTTLSEAVRAAVRGDFQSEVGPITLAYPEPMAFRDILKELARVAGRKVTFVPVPWRLLYAGLWVAEHVGLRLRFRSDSIISFVYQDMAPDFSAQKRLGISPLPFSFKSP